MNATIMLKNGHKISVPIKTTIDAFIIAIINGVSPKVVTNYYVEGPLLINFSDVSAIYPEGWDK